MTRKLHRVRASDCYRHFSSPPMALNAWLGGVFQVGRNCAADFRFRLQTGSAAHSLSALDDEVVPHARDQPEMMCHCAALSDPDVDRMWTLTMFVRTRAKCWVLWMTRPGLSR